MRRVARAHGIDAGELDVDLVLARAGWPDSLDAELIERRVAESIRVMPGARPRGRWLARGWDRLLAFVEDGPSRWASRGRPLAPPVPERWVDRRLERRR